MSKVIVVPIFWGTTWAQNQGDKITGMIAFYQVTDPTTLLILLILIYLLGDLTPLTLCPDI